MKYRFMLYCFRCKIYFLHLNYELKLCPNCAKDILEFASYYKSKKELSIVDMIELL